MKTTSLAFTTFFLCAVSTRFLFGKGQDIHIGEGGVSPVSKPTVTEAVLNVPSQMVDAVAQAGEALANLPGQVKDAFDKANENPVNKAAIDSTKGVIEAAAKGDPIGIAKELVVGKIELLEVALDQKERAKAQGQAATSTPAVTPEPPNPSSPIPEPAAIAEKPIKTTPVAKVKPTPKPKRKQSEAPSLRERIDFVTPSQRTREINEILRNSPMKADKWDRGIRDA